MTCLSCTVDVRAFSDTRGQMLVQTEEPSDFEDWYEPDDAYQNKNPEQPDEGRVVPEGGENEPRVAPDEYIRPKER